MIRNSDPLSDTLKDLKQSIRSGLVVSLIQAEWQIIKTRTLTCEKTSIIKQHKRDDFTCI
jgi:hypothetical protein